MEEETESVDCNTQACCKDDTCSNGGGSLDVLLEVGNVITSENNKLELNMQDDGNLVLYCRSIPIWSSKTDGHGGKSAASFQKDGNLVLMENNDVLYTADSHDKRGEKLVVQDDANLVIYNNNDEAIWSSKTNGKCEGDLGCVGDTCSNGFGSSNSVDVPLKEGNVITSENNNVELKMQDDGNLVLYCKSNAIWSSKTDGHGGKSAASFQKDGNLVLMENNDVLYTADSHDKEGAELVVQDDGNLVIYTNDRLKAIWSSETSGRC